MKTRTLLVDSSYLLKRSFHGAKDTYSSQFGHIGGLYSFMTTIRKLIKEHMINKVVLVWDGQRGGVKRFLIDSAYKANRKNKEWSRIELSEYEIKVEKEKEESLLKQRQRIRAYAEELFLRQIEVDDIEADDIIAAYCLKYNNKEEIYLYSNDRDFAQLLDLNVTIILPNINQLLTRVNYMMHYNHHYSNALTIKIIEGDVADNIQGVGGLKEKTLLKYFPELKYRTMTVRDICIKADEICKQRVLDKKKPIKSIESLLNNVKRLKLNHSLTNLRTPLLNESAENEINLIELPLSPDGRGSHNLYKLMQDDGFLGIYGSTFVNYVEPFYAVIMNEKQQLIEHNRNNGKYL